MDWERLYSRRGELFVAAICVRNSCECVCSHMCVCAQEYSCPQKPDHNGLLADMETIPSFPSFLSFQLLEPSLLWRHGISGRGPAWHTPDSDAVPEPHTRFPGATEHQHVHSLISLSPRPDP